MLWNVWGPGRGDCEPPVPEVVGKYMRAKVVASLKAVAAKEKEDAAAEDEDYEEGVADDLSVCCHGRAAAPEVTAQLVGCFCFHCPMRGCYIQPLHIRDGK